MSLGEYLFGVIGLAAVAIPVGMGGVRLRRRLLPGWEGAPARLGEAVLGVALLTGYALVSLIVVFCIMTGALLIARSIARPPAFASATP